MSLRVLVLLLFSLPIVAQIEDTEGVIPRNNRIKAWFVERPQAELDAALQQLKQDQSKLFENWEILIL